MKTTVIILSTMLFSLITFAQNSEKKFNVNSYPEQKYLIKDNGVDIFILGHKIPTNAEGYLISKSIETRTEEGDDFDILIHTVFEDGQAILKIERLYCEVDNNPYQIDQIFVLSEKCKTAENIGLHSTIEEFIAAYPDFTIWYSYVSNRYVIETGLPFEGIQFELDGKDFLDENGPISDSAMTILKASDFKKGAKIKGIRIWWYGDL